MLVFILTGINGYSQLLEHKVSLDLHCKSLDQCILQLQQATGFSFAYETSGLSLLPGKKRSFHNKEVGSVLNDLLENTNFHFEEKHQVIIIGPVHNRKDSFFQFKGVLEDKKTGEKIAGAAVYSPDDRYLGTYTDINGAFTLNSLDDTLRLQISYLGYKPAEVRLYAKDAPMVRIKMDILAADLDTMLVVLPNDIIRSSALNSLTISPSTQMKFLPKFCGNSDLITMIKSTPGISESNNGSGSLIVRGGAPDQNLILLDDMVIYGETHLLGLLSSVSAAATKELILYKGSFPARYSGRISSVWDITLKEGDPEKYQGSISLGSLASDFTLSGPLYKNAKTTFALSGRRSYHDYYLRLFNPGMTFYFQDASVKLHHRFSDNDHLYLTGYTSKDRFKIVNEHYYENAEDKQSSEIITINKAAGVKWRHFFSSRFHTDLNFSYSGYQFLQNGESFLRYRLYNEVIKQQNQDRSSFYDLNYKFRGKYTITKEHILESGLYYISRRFSPQTMSEKLAYSDSLQALSWEFVSFYKNSEARESGFFIEDNITLPCGLRLSGGAHFNYYYYGYGNTPYFTVQPRVTVTYKTASDWLLGASYVRIVQNVHRLSFGITSLPVDFWTPATDVIRPQSSDQFSLTLKGKLLNNQVDFAVESYYKLLQNMSEYLFFTPPDTIPGMAPGKVEISWQDAITAGKGRSYGIEFSFSKSKGRLNGWLNYALSWSNRTFPEINNGTVFLSRNDRRHNLNLISVFKIKKQLELSAVFTYQSKPPLPVFMVKSDVLAQYANDLRETQEVLSHIKPRTYHRLDVGVNWYTKPFKNTDAVCSFSILNAYNRTNNVFYHFLNGNNRFAQISLLPISLALSYTLNFGSYWLSNSPIN